MLPSNATSRGVSAVRLAADRTSGHPGVGIRAAEAAGGTSATLQCGITVWELPLEPTPRGALPVRLPADQTVLGFVREGTFQARLPGLNALRFREGEWFAARARSARIRAAKRTTLLLFLVPGERLAGLTGAHNHAGGGPLRCFTCPRLFQPSLLHHAAGQRLAWAARQVAPSAAEEGPDGRLTLEIRCLEWLRELFRQPALAGDAPCGEDNACAENRVRELARYLETHLDHPHTLADLSRRFHLNDFKLKRLFKATFGTTVFHYLRALRMREAGRLLAEPGSSVLETANAVGYTNPSHFARNFRDYHGVLPKAYQSLRHGRGQPVP